MQQPKDLRHFRLKLWEGGDQMHTLNTYDSQWFRQYEAYIKGFYVGWPSAVANFGTPHKFSYICTH